MLTGRGGNIGLSVGKSGVFLIDDQYAPLSDKILATVKAITPDPVRFVVNTHWHGDHTGGNENLGKAGALHRRARERAQAHEHRELQRGLPAHDARRLPRAALPVVTFADGAHLPLERRGDPRLPRAARPHRR